MGAGGNRKYLLTHILIHVVDREAVTNVRQQLTASKAVTRVR